VTRNEPTVVLWFHVASGVDLTRSTLAWAETVSAADQQVRVRLALLDSGTVPLPDTVTSGLRDRCQDLGIELQYDRLSPGTSIASAAAALHVEPHELVLMADADDVPSPWLLERLLVHAHAPEAAVVQARVLPLAAEPTPGDDEDGPSGTRSACALVAGSLCLEATLIEAASSAVDVRRLAGHALAQGLRVVVEPTAAVFSTRRVGADLAAVPRASHDQPLVQRGPPRARSTPHPATLLSTSLGEMLDQSSVEVRAPHPATDPSCFLTVLTRTQGTRPRCLEEMLLCLAGQTGRDFEVVLACHRTTAATMAETTAILGRLPGWLRDRVRLVEVSRSGRAAPLNDGFADARGEYVAILDDDDTVFSHWVETFQHLADRGPGRLLRAATLRLDVERGPGDDVIAIPVGSPRLDWPAEFELVDHLWVNSTPCMSVAFPRSVFHDLGLRFDEEMTATEDWEFLVRAAGVVGVESAPEVTSVYRWWVDHGSSRTIESSDAWLQGKNRAHGSFDDRVMLLPRGSAGRVREIFDELHEARVELAKAIDAHDRLYEEYQRTVERVLAAQADAEKSKIQVRKLKRQVRASPPADEGGGPTRG